MTQPKSSYKANPVERTTLINLERGQLPPQAIDLEEAVLGAMLIDSRGLDECLLILKSADVFYKDGHRFIFEAIESLYADAQGVDVLTVSARLKAMGRLEQAGGDYYLLQLTQKVSSSAHIEYHSRILLQMYIKRGLIRAASTLMATAYDATKDSLELLREWGASLDAVTEVAMQGKKGLSYAAGLDMVQKRVEFLTHKDPEEVTGAYTGFKVIDLFTGGYQPGELIVDAARPGMGKTAKMMKAVVANAKAGRPVGVISAEMSAVQLITRSVAIDTDFHLKQLTKTGFEKQAYFTSLSSHVHRMRKYPIFIDDTPSPDIRSVQATLRSWKRSHGITIAFVDYLQLVGDATKEGYREQEIASISRKLKALAKELEIPIVALSQLSRSVETRGGSRRPTLSDLRESGAIEQDADMVCFIYRPEYYGIELDDELAAQNANTEIIFAKYRGGAPGTSIGLWWQGDKTKFMDPEEHLAQLEEEAARPAAQGTQPLPKPTANEAFGTPAKTNDNPDDVPF